MSQSRKKRADKRAVEQAPSPKLQAGDRRGRRTGIIIAAVVIAVMAATIGFFSYQQYIAPYRHIVIKADDINIRMDYFLKRIRLAGGTDPIDMLAQLTKEQVIKLAAPQYGIEVSPEDVDEALRTMFRGESETISESEFKEWYRQLLNETGLSDSEFKEYTAILILRTRLHEYLAERVPTVAEQIHLYIIFVETNEEAEKVRARWEAGEDFSDLARELSLDETIREKGGELGWFPRGGVLDAQLEYEAFNLTTGNVSQPLPLITEESSAEGEPVPTIVGYYLVMVSEKAAARELDEDSLQVIKGNALEDWLSVERGNHEVRWHGFNNGYDSETDFWVKLQLAKMARQRENE
ncbi:Foldase protein PrsA [subsurface metagenome]